MHARGKTFNSQIIPCNFSVQDDAAMQRIALSLQDSLLQGDGCCTRQLIGAIVALAARPSLPLLPSQQSSFIKFMVTTYYYTPYAAYSTQSCYLIKTLFGRCYIVVLSRLRREMLVTKLCICSRVQSKEQKHGFGLA